MAIVSKVKGSRKSGREGVSVLDWDEILTKFNITGKMKEVVCKGIVYPDEPLYEKKKLLI